MMAEMGCAVIWVRLVKQRQVVSRVRWQSRRHRVAETPSTREKVAAGDLGGPVRSRSLRKLRIASGPDLRPHQIGDDDAD
jgi:hypothetical protein